MNQFANEIQVTSVEQKEPREEVTVQQRLTVGIKVQTGIKAGPSRCFASNTPNV